MKNDGVIALISESAPTAVINSLRSLGFSPRLLPEDDRLDLPVRSHADMVMLKVENKIFTSEKYFRLAYPIFKELENIGYEIISCNADIKREYPFDVAFDLAVIGNNFLGRTDVCPGEIKSFAQANNYALTKIKQGYAKCSSVITDNAVISSDKGIIKAAGLIGADTLCVSGGAGTVALPGYDCGFIGGASGVFENTVYFSGDINRHPDGKKIKDFCKAHGYETRSLCDGMLQDVGGIIFAQP